MPSLHIVETERPTLASPTRLATLQALERKLETLLPVAQETPADDQKQPSVLQDDDEDDDEASGEGSRFPNLKYAKAKYRNVESILKYVERDEDRGGVKLVIMNFND